MASVSTGDTLPGGGTAGGIVSGSDTWANPSNITNDGTSDAVAVIGAPPPPFTSDDLLGSAYGFSIPTGATIDGIIVKIKRCGDASGLNDSIIGLTKNGSSQVGDNKSTGAPWILCLLGKETVTHGGATDLWNTTWTPAEINSFNFGAFIVAAGLDTGRVDFIKVDVHYTEAFGGKVNSVAAADIGKVNGVAIANIASVSGV